MLIGLLYRLRRYRVPVGTAELLAAAAALRAGAHEHSITGLYYVTRSVMIHSENHLDAFDRAFAEQFGGLEEIPVELSDEIAAWLDEADTAEQALDASGPDHLAETPLDELLREFAERQAEQTERHDGGNYWVGTGGTSAFGQSGRAASGISTGSSGGGRNSIRVADARQYKAYRSDVVLDIRQMELALRRLRSFVREGAQDELDIDATIDATARNAGDIEVVVRPPSKPDTHVILMIDVGGSMFPYSRLMSELFSAAKKATHFKDLKTYYFHNCVYGVVYETDRFTDPVLLDDVIRSCGSNYRLIMVGDALMAPYELFYRGQQGGINTPLSGLEWLQRMKEHWDHSVWLNPEPQRRWSATTISQIGTVFDMFELTLDGLTEAMRLLNRGARSAR